MSVEPSATADEIKSAYRRLAKELHPDKNPSTGANARFQAVNEAYATLNDPELRRAYDTYQYTSETKRPTSSRLEPICCSKCGKVTAQPRALVFRYVVSVVLMTLRNPEQGIYCSACARKGAFRASFISSIAGWWGFPWGPIFTVSEIIRNAIGGRRSHDIEEKMLWYNTLAFLSQGRHDLAYALAQQLLSAKNKEICANAIDLIGSLRQSGTVKTSSTLRNPWNVRPKDFFVHALCLIWLPLVGITIFWAPEFLKGSYPLPGTEASSATVVPAALPSADSGSETQPTIALCPFPPSSGEILDGYVKTTAPGHVIEIDNGSGGDAIVKVRDAFSNRLAVSFFVANNQTASFTHLPDGTYRIQYAFGQGLGSDCRNFAKLFAADQFPEVETLQTTFTQTEITRSHLSYTLYPVPSGNVRPERIDATAFSAE